MALTDLTCKNAKATGKQYKITDGAGLYLLVSAKGSRLWRFDYAFDGKRKTAALGAYPAVSLIDARAQRETMKAALRDGRDPVEKTKTDALTLRDVATTWFLINKPKWKSSYSDRFWRRIEDDILPTLGDRVLTSIKPPEILKLLRVIEDRDAIYTAKRIKQMVSTIFSFAIAEGYTTTNPTSDLNAALKPLPREKVHRAALREKDLADYFRRLREFDGDEQTKLGLLMVTYTFVRTNEIRFAQWSEFEGNTWKIPGSRMKMGADLHVHLTPRVMRMLDRLRELNGHQKWLLPGIHPAKPISENTLIYALYRCGLKGHATVHGFRGTASTILNDSGLWNEDWIERQLAHVAEDEVRSAYNAAEYWPHRVKMMQWYSDLLERYETKPQFDLSDLLS